MTTSEFRAILENEDLIDLGMQADQVRARQHPDRIVTYGASSETARSAFEAITFRRGESVEDLIERFEQIRQTSPVSLQPIFGSEITGAEYLKRVALCRLYFSEVSNIEVSPADAGLKLAQLALRFGANDLGLLESEGDEERYRTVIRDAGFIPHRRDYAYRTLFLH